MSDIRVHHCPRCVTDYQPEVIYCVDCGAELVDRYEETDPRRRRMPGEERPAFPGDPPAERVATLEDPAVDAMPPGWSAVYFASTASELAPLADRLASRGIELRILDRPEEGGAEPPRRRFELWVADDNHAAALEDIRDLAGPVAVSCETPGCDTPDCDASTGNAGIPDAEFDPRSGYRRCPACGARLAPRAPECPDCGLSLGAEQGDGPGPPVEPT